MKKIISYLLRLMMRVNASRPEKNQRLLDARIASGLEKWIEEKGYCQSDMNLSDVAAMLDVSAEALSYYCTTTLGKRFSSLRKDLRIKEAHRLIAAHPRLPLVRVAFSVGIHDKGNFRRQFFELSNYTPGEWRRQCLAKQTRKQV